MWVRITLEHSWWASRALWEPLLRADETYLSAMFQQVESAHGSTEAYLREELGVDERLVARLREHLVESPQ